MNWVRIAGSSELKWMFIVGWAAMADSHWAIGTEPEMTQTHGKNAMSGIARKF